MNAIETYYDFDDSFRFNRMRILSNFIGKRVGDRDTAALFVV
jgi:hypothetical protein